MSIVLASRTSYRFGLMALAVFSVPFAGCAHQPPLSLQESSMNHPVEKTASVEISSILTGGQEVSLRVELEHSDFKGASNMVEVRYRLTNRRGGDALMVFDRGKYADWAGTVYNPGPVGHPVIVIEGDGASLIHSAWPRTPDDIARGVPARPLATRVKPGSSVEEQFSVRDISSRRLRWCVAVMPFEKRYFQGPTKTSSGVDIWTADDAVVESQQLLCTPWYDVASAQFESPQDGA